MHAAVENYLNKVKEKEEKYKKAFLEERGIYDREYVKVEDPNNVPADAIMDGEGKFFKRVPIEITDEEWDAVVEASRKKIDVSTDNKVAKTIKVIAIITYIMNVIAGIVLWSELSSFILFVTAVFVGFVSGTLMLGFAEVIKLLDDIKKKN